MRFRSPIVFESVLLAVLFAFLPARIHSSRAQQTSPSTPPPASPPRAKPISPSTPPPPPPPETSSDTQAETPKVRPIDPSTPPPPPDETAAKPAAETTEPAFDPYHAQKSLDVGTFYMKTGRYDAAIDRFQEAARYQPSLAMPWRLLGEAYEKQRAYAMAIEAYKKYLEVFPTAADAAKITKQISMLEEKVGKESSKGPAH